MRIRGAVVRVVALGVAVVTVFVVAAVSWAADEGTSLVSLQSAGDGGAAGEAGSDNPSVSPDGRYVAFESEANNLSTADNDNFQNIFVRDTLNDTTTLVSRQSVADGGAGADAHSFEPAISADGRYVAFHTDADNLSANDAFVNVFVRDLQTNTTTLVSRESVDDGGDPADASSSLPSMSADGRFVAFVSSADNLSTDANIAAANIFVRDLQEEETELVSRQSQADGGVGADNSSNEPSISADGRYVAFQSSANNLSDDDAQDFEDIFVRDRDDSETLLASRESGADGAGAGDHSREPAISGNGRYVAFESLGDNLSTADEDGVGGNDIFVRDLETNATSLISRSTGAGGGGGNGSSDDPAISADGQLVAFESNATNLSTAATAVTNIFVRDTGASTTTLVSRQSAADGGAGADNEAFRPAVAAEGRYVAFDSMANNLSALDATGTSDVFLRDLVSDPPPPGGDTVAPDLDLSGKATQGLGKPVKVKVSCDEACSVLATGTVKPKGAGGGKGKRAKTLKLKPAQADLAAGETRTLKLKPSKKAARKLKRAAKAKARISATATDAAGNSSTASLRVKLR